MLINKLQEKLEKVKQEFGDIEVCMACWWGNVTVKHLCLVKDLEDNSFLIYITDDVKGLATILEDDNFELIREF